MKLEILAFPDERLRTKAIEIIKFDKTTKQLVKDMLETMYENNGIGLAATQVDKHVCIFVADTSKNKDNPLYFINPVIISKEGEKINEEGCLSIIGFNANVKRAEKIVVEAFNSKGEKFKMEADKLLAVCIQHETDHLKGILFIDYLSKLKQKRLLEKINKNKL